MISTTALLVSGLGLLSHVTAIPTLSIKGTKYYTDDGQQFFIKGVAYQPTPDDPLVNTPQCQRDIPLLQELGANAIRVYHIEPQGNHDECMRLLSEAGIYLFFDLEDRETSITSSAPFWTRAQYNKMVAKMDMFHAYDNMGGWFIGNEILNDGATSDAATYVKATVRDMKAHREAQGYREIGIGYAHTDATILLPNMQNYMVCGGNTSETVDFFALNTYRWCGPNDVESIGPYAELTSYIEDYPVPFWISETGCNTAPPRTFQDQEAIFGPKMTPYWSGAVVYEWIQAVHNYGLINYDSSGTPVPIQPDFDNLKAVWATVSPAGIAENQYTPSNSAPACPAFTAGVWEVDGNAPLPPLADSPPESLTSYQTSFPTSSFPDSFTSSSTTSAAEPTETEETTSATESDDNAASRVSFPVLGFSDKGVFGSGAVLVATMLGLIYWL